MELVHVHTTVATQEDARRLAQTLVQSRLAACVQIAPVESLYVWQDEMQQETEWQLSCKTTRVRQAALMERLQALHPYTLPAMEVTAVLHTTPAFAQWVAENTSEG
jgi:periplasmic divalent cation tolerance protein